MLIHIKEPCIITSEGLNLLDAPTNLIVKMASKGTFKLHWKVNGVKKLARTKIYRLWHSQGHIFMGAEKSVGGKGKWSLGVTRSK